MAEGVVKTDLRYVLIRKSVTVPANTRINVDLTDDIIASGLTMATLKAFDVLMDYSTRYYDLNIDTKYKGAKCGLYISNIGSENVTNNLIINLFY